MRKYLISLLAILAFPAMAADNFKVPTYITGSNWTYNWIGIQGGYGDYGSLNNPFVTFDHNGWFGGLTIGTQRQYGNWVLGIEAEGNYSNLKGATAIGPVGIQHDVEAFGSLRGRLGYATSQFHLYGLGGLAMATTGASISAGPISSADSKTHWGWVAGAGLEYAFAPNWVLGAEWAYYNFGSENYGFAVAGPIGLITPADFDFHTVKAKAAYRW